MDKGFQGWIYLLDPCGCPPVLDDDPKECQQLIFPESEETPCKPYSVLSQRTISNVVAHKLFISRTLTALWTSVPPKRWLNKVLQVNSTYGT